MLTDETGGVRGVRGGIVIMQRRDRKPLALAMVGQDARGGECHRDAFEIGLVELRGGLVMVWMVLPRRAW